MTVLAASAMSPSGAEVSPSLSALMREGSRAEHEEAESSTFMSALLSGQVSSAGYACYLSMLRSVYAALESVGRDLASDPIASAVVDPDLDRLAAIDADLAFWSPGGAPAVDSPAVVAYVARIQASASWGGLYVAQHYTRYLGDLSGGQAIGRILSRTFDLDGAGVAFYEFVAVPKPKLYKDGYRARLDALDLPREDAERILGEVRDTFGLNGALFAELSGRLDEFRR